MVINNLNDKKAVKYTAYDEYWFNRNCLWNRELLYNNYSKYINKWFDLAGAISLLVLWGIGLIFKFAELHNFHYVTMLFILCVVCPIKLSNIISDLIKKRTIGLDALMVIVAILSFFIKERAEGSLLLVLFNLAEAVDFFVINKANEIEIKSSITVESCTVLDEDNKEKIMSVTDIKFGDIISVNTGEIFPVDMVLYSEVTVCSQAHMTGEQSNIYFNKGDTILSGSINMGLKCHGMALSGFNESMLGKIMSIIFDPSRNTAPMISWISKIASKYTIFVLFVTVSYCAALIYGGQSIFEHQGALYKAAALMTIISPCAIFISIPVIYTSAICFLAKHGIIVRGSDVLNKIKDIDTICFDKTGTLTHSDGKSNFVSSFEVRSGSVQDFANLLFDVEKISTHPIGRALFEWSKQYAVANPNNTYDVKILNGEITGNFNGTWFSISQFLDHNNKEDHLTMIKLGDHSAIATISLKIRDDAHHVIDHLKSLNKEVYMITGDSKDLAYITGDRLGIKRSNIFYGLLPEDKLSKISSLELKNRTMMIGDGINDAPSLSRACVGVSLVHTGSYDIAVFSSDILIIGDSLSKIKMILKVGSKIYKVLIQNMIIAILIIVGGMLSVLFMNIDMWLAVLLHEGSTILLSINALRLLTD